MHIVAQMQLLIVLSFNFIKTNWRWLRVIYGIEHVIQTKRILFIVFHWIYYFNSLGKNLTLFAFRRQLSHYTLTYPTRLFGGVLREGFMIILMLNTLKFKDRITNPTGTSLCPFLLACFYKLKIHYSIGFLFGLKYVEHTHTR